MVVLSQRPFYRQLLRKAEERFDAHLAEMYRKGKSNGEHIERQNEQLEHEAAKAH